MPTQPFAEQTGALAARRGFTDRAITPGSTIPAARASTTFGSSDAGPGAQALDPRIVTGDVLDHLIRVDELVIDVPHDGEQ